MLDTLYGSIVTARRAWYARHPELRGRPRQPVVSVGNLRVGGSRKTPVVAAIASMLRAMGERPAIISRGYKRRHMRDGVVVVRDAARLRADLDAAGDEPLMLARALDGVAVLVSADRLIAARLAEARLGCTVHVLDDGFQHLPIAHDVDLLMVSRDDLSEYVLPRGRLREPLANARQADALVAIDADPREAAEMAARLGVERWFTLGTTDEPASLLEPMGVAVTPAEAPRVVLVSGIARPARFLADVERRGWTVAETLVFRDHHPFSRDDLARMTARLAATGADLLLTTEKDAVRLLPLRPLPVRVAALPLRVRIEPAEEFEAWIRGRLDEVCRRLPHLTGSPVRGSESTIPSRVRAPSPLPPPS